MDKQKEVLQLAGKLALAAQRVLSANICNLSYRISELQQALNEYDNKIIEISNESKNQ